MCYNYLTERKGYGMEDIKKQWYPIFVAAVMLELKENWGESFV